MASFRNEASDFTLGSVDKNQQCVLPKLCMPRISSRLQVLVAKRTKRNVSNCTFLPFCITLKPHAHYEVLLHTEEPGLCKVSVGKVRLWMTLQLKSLGTERSRRTG